MVSSEGDLPIDASLVLADADDQPGAPALAKGADGPKGIPKGHKPGCGCAVCRSARRKQQRETGAPAEEMHVSKKKLKRRHSVTAIRATSADEDLLIDLPADRYPAGPDDYALPSLLARTIEYPTNSALVSDEEPEDAKTVKQEFDHLSAAQTAGGSADGSKGQLMVKKAKRGRQELLALGLPEGPVSEGRPGKRAAAAAASEAIARSADEEGRRFSIAAASAAVSPSKLPSPRLTAEEQVTADEVAAAAREADLQLRREAFDALMANTIHRGRRKQRTSNPSNRAGGFANSPLRVSVIPEDPLPIEGDLDALVQAAMEVRVSLGLPHDKPLNLRQVMKAGILVAQPVEFRSRHGDVMLRGSVASDGLIACGCRNCSGARVSCSDFEEHAGSRERRPGENIFLSSINTSLRDFCMAVNARLGEDRHGSNCSVCNGEGDLLCCDGCTVTTHVACAGLAQVPKGTWYCSACTAAGVAQRAKPPKHATPRKLQHGSAAAVVPKRKLEDGRLDGTCVSPAGRVHMAAPSSRGMTGARRERNSNKHKRLFMGEPGGLRNGEKVAYITAQGERLLEGVVRITSSANGGADASGILCGCCNIVISCSQFEAHAGRGTRRAPYDNIYTTKGVSLRKMAAALPPHVSESPHHYQAASSALARQQGDAVDSTDDPEVVAGRGREAMGDLDIVAGGCVLCNQTDFQRGTFGARTIIICDQCEREFHVGCLKKFGRGHLHELPDGDWFCSPECHSINDSLRARVLAGPVPISGDHTWQLLRGKDGTHATTWALKSAAELLQESFDPIIDIISGQDLLNVMVYAQELGEWDYTGMYTAVLRHKGKPVAAAVFRVFGPQLAELPLVATRLTARRQGHARVLIRAFEAMLAQAGVQCLSLPAAHETVGTWMHGFGFAHMPAEQLRAARSELRLLIFPGTEVLCKPLVKPAEALPPAQLLPSPAPPAAEAAQKASPDPSPRAALQAQARDQRRHRGRANNPDPAAAVEPAGHAGDAAAPGGHPGQDAPPEPQPGPATPTTSADLGAPLRVNLGDEEDYDSDLVSLPAAKGAKAARKRRLNAKGAADAAADAEPAGHAAPADAAAAECGDDPGQAAEQDQAKDAKQQQPTKKAKLTGKAAKGGKKSRKGLNPTSAGSKEAAQPAAFAGKAAAQAAPAIATKAAPKGAGKKWSSTAKAAAPRAARPASAAPAVPRGPPAASADVDGKPQAKPAAQRSPPQKGAGAGGKGSKATAVSSRTRKRTT